MSISLNPCFFSLCVSTLLSSHKLSVLPQISSILNFNFHFASVATASTQRETLPYICGLARIECERESEHSTRSDRVTNIGQRFSVGTSGSHKIKI